MKSGDKAQRLANVQSKAFMQTLPLSFQYGPGMIVFI
jgi:hypothetical protein